MKRREKNIKGLPFISKKIVRGGIQSIFHLIQTIALLKNLDAILLNQSGSQLIQKAIIDNKQLK